MKKRIIVLGAGESGTGAAVLAKIQGFDVFISDFREISKKYKDILEKYNIEYEEKKHTERLIFDADEIIKSPGISDKTPIVHFVIEIDQLSADESLYSINAQSSTR